MAKYNGIELKALRTEKSSDGINLQKASLYLEGEKIATLLMEKEGLDGPVFVQLFMMYGYSETALRAEMAARGTSFEDLLEQTQWLKDMEQQYNRHQGVSAGIAALQHVTKTVTMGIPSRLAEASEEEILRELQHFISKNTVDYGECTGYAIFRSPEDFELGEPIALSALKG